MGLLNMLGFVSKKEFNRLKETVAEYRKSEHRLRNMDTDCQLVKTVKDNKYNTRYKKSEVIEELVARIKRLEEEIGNLERGLYKEEGELMSFWSTDSRLKRRVNNLAYDIEQIEENISRLEEKVIDIYEGNFYGLMNEGDLEERLYDIESNLRKFDEWAQQINRKFMCEPTTSKGDKGMKEEKKQLLDRYFQYLQILQEGNREPSTSNTANIKDIKEKIENLLEDENNRLKYKEGQLDVCKIRIDW